MGTDVSLLAIYTCILLVQFSRNWLYCILEWIMHWSVIFQVILTRIHDVVRNLTNAVFVSLTHHLTSAFVKTSRRAAHFSLWAV